VFSTLVALWHRLVDPQPDPPRPLVLVTGVLALVSVMPRPLWRITRYIVTIAHEGGHAAAALLSGRRLSGIRLHSDTSGLTLSKGRPTGFGMVVTGLAGYVTPSLIGLGGAALLATGHITALLWAGLVLLPLMLVMIRNLFGVLAVATAGAVMVFVSMFTGSTVQAAFAYFIVWLLLLGGLRPVLELQTLRWRGQLPYSDADQLARLTRVPGLVWVVFFALVACAALLLGGQLLLIP
jgi:Peptidase M50B-like